MAEVSHRKPIGEAGCCESWMAEEATDGSKSGWVARYLSVYLSAYLSIKLVKVVKLVSLASLASLVWCSVV